MDQTERTVLGRQVQEPTADLDIVEAGVHGAVILRCTEFTSLCPVTKQPDFGSITIAYGPAGGRIVETKSLKLYLWTWREKAMFVEHVVRCVSRHLHAALDPEWLVVDGRFRTRGGIIPEAVTHHGAVPQHVWGLLR